MKNIALLVLAVSTNSFLAGCKTLNCECSFEDGDKVIAHTAYDFYGPKVGFDIFRFEDGLIVEHWDNLQALAETSVSGHSQFDGQTLVQDLDKTAANKALARLSYRGYALKRV